MSLPNLDKYLTNTMSLGAREATIKSAPLFGLLTTADVHLLASMTQELTLAPDTIIVIEGEIVDSVFFIIEGSTEVTQIISTVDRTEIMHIAVLIAGDTIGLTDTGFFSKSGIRKATVTAKTTVLLLKLELESLNLFLKNPDLTYPALKNISENIVLMNFLKETSPFKHLANNKIRQIAHHVKRYLVKAGGIIIKENDPADICYFLLSGRASIFTMNGSDKKIITILESPSMIGESIFLEKGVRNASACAETDCEFFIITHDDFMQIINPDDFFLNSLELSRIEQFRPKPHPKVIIQNTDTLAPYSMNFLSNDDTKKQITISQADLEIWKQLDGVKSLLTIQKQLKYENLETIYQCVKNLSNLGFIEAMRLDVTKQSASFITHIFKIIKSLWK